MGSFGVVVVVCFFVFFSGVGWECGVIVGRRVEGGGVREDVILDAVVSYVFSH